MKNKKENGLININFEKNEDTVNVTITDNGPGINAYLNAETLTSNSSESTSKYKSMGLNITKKRLNIFSDRDKNEPYAIHEIKDSEGNVIGTSIRLSFKQL